MRACVAHALFLSLVSARTLHLEQSFGLSDVWTPRCSVELERVDAEGSSRWRAVASGAGSISAPELPLAEEALRSGSFFRVRAREEGARGGFVVGATRMCALQAAAWKHNVVFALAPNDGALVSIEVRPVLGDDFSGCAPSGARAGAPLPAPDAPWSSRFGIGTAEEAAHIPAGAAANVKLSSPYVGQSPISETDALAAAAGSAPLSAQAREALAAAQAREAAEREANKGWFERAQPYLLPISIALLLNSVFGKGDAAPAAGKGRPAGGAAK